MSRVNVEVTISAPPVLNLVSPQSGPIAGGTSVIIAGHDLTGAKAVRFGKVSAASFKVNSDNAITAVSPPSASVGTVDISVTSAAGTTAVTSADRFTYVVNPPTSPPRSCVVPKLFGKSLKAAKRKLRKPDCKIGSVRKTERGHLEDRKGRQAEPEARQDPGARDQGERQARLAALAMWPGERPPSEGQLTEQRVDRGAGL